MSTELGVRKKAVLILVVSAILFGAALSATQSQGIGGTYEHARIGENVEYILFKKDARFVDPWFVIHGFFEGKGLWIPLNLWGDGIYYRYTTHNIVTNGGQDFTQNKLFNSGYGSNTQFAEYIALSTDGTSPAYTDTTCPSEITTGGLERAQATYSGGTPSSGDVTARISHTFTASASFTNVQKGCTFTLSAAGTLFAENTFASVNLNSGDTLTINWDYTYSN